MAKRLRFTVTVEDDILVRLERPATGRRQSSGRTTTAAGWSIPDSG